MNCKNGSQTGYSQDRRKVLSILLTGIITLPAMSAKVLAQVSDTKEKIVSEIKNKIPTKIKPEKNVPVTPPGSLGVK